MNTRTAAFANLVNAANVAIVIKIAGMPQPGDIERFEREAKAIAALNHAHICQIYDVGPNYLVMELFEGDALLSKEKPGPLPLDEALRYAVQIADAVSTAHAKGITHRDLKPGNVMVTRDHSIKLLDFGLAKQETPDQSVGSFATLPLSLTQPGMVIGTVAYMSPEQAQGLAVDPAPIFFPSGYCSAKC